ncbi:hypothetical protein AAV35_013975 (plasmid) [Salimicrobium jeotgali]|uniref:YdbS-like PH domain-containing protein n=1 Tax=Salimicrobium jeotgali TaxID=1230341 RepID=K2GK17_9BACI|nr:PH domain-containing protein [Salimicrobium jeotgali]AKG05850.1 hypothetical protein AAV35_013975 [Salimicrobium jeotgali]EKE30784.1 hypothetical protein MJ3_11720 [Salimicrobium jeotgali]MBM7697619.1 membrane protein YdbS with pleckstrin-like domain [Salimicrobium jeotgali]
MDQELIEPTQKISKNAVKLWRTTSVLGFIAMIIILVIFKFLISYFNWLDWLDILVYIVGGLFIVGLFFDLFVVPAYKQKTWRYGIDQNCIQLKYGGIIKKTHTVIPMDKVYFVNTFQHPLLQKYKLSSVKIGTVAYTHEIPALPEEQAKNVRRHIAALSGISDSNSRKEEGGNIE